MSAISEKFEELKSRGEMALITFTMSGDPSPSETVEIASAMERGGADMIELGLCFSDPIADGPVIQAASDRAMRTGISQEDYFAVAGEIHNLVSVPLISLTYYNMVLRYGVSRFMRSCVRSGISGLVVPDLPVDEAGEVIEASRRHGVDTVFLAAPTSSDDRIGRIARSSSGFVYLVSVLGVTGTRRKIPEVGELIHKRRSGGSRLWHLLSSTCIRVEEDGCRRCYSGECDS
ncbi:MAG: tryptophan synthase subunit alpha [Candidatus Hadarchaeales archaeon]